MALADVVLHTSANEGMSNVVAEAQLVGTPVVACDTPGVSELIRNGETGLLRSKNDVEGLASACIQLLNDPALAAAMGHSGHRHISSNFSSSGLAERFIQVCESEPSHQACSNP